MVSEFNGIYRLCLLLFSCLFQQTRRCLFLRIGLGVTDRDLFMREALALAETARQLDEVPVGAIIVQGSLRMGQGYNQNISQNDPTAHAEIVALRDACLYADNYRLPGTTLYVSLEPCLMCFMALVQARVSHIVFGAGDPKGGFTNFFNDVAYAKLNHRPEVTGGILAEDCSALVSGFFQEKRVRGKRKWMRETT